MRAVFSGCRLSLWVSALVVFAGGYAWAGENAPAGLDASNVILTAPTPDARGALPLGNGQVGVSAWVEPSGDLICHISNTDAFSEVCRLLKIGKIRVHLTPSPLEAGTPFREELKIRDGRLVIDMGDTHLELFVETGRPVIRIAGQSATPRSVTISYEGWRNERRVLTGEERDRSAWTMKGASAGIEVAEAADIMVPASQAPQGIAWYHRNETSIVPLTLKHEAVDQVPGSFDPLLHRTFGAWVAGPGFVRQDDSSLGTTHPVGSFDLRIASPDLVANSAEDWIEAARTALQSAPALDQARRETEAAWSEFWGRSWVIAKLPPAKLSADRLTQGYNLSRYAFACQGRGEFPIKFNGGIFTVDPGLANRKYPFNADWRNWGDGYWYQNTRHMYHPMLMAGDFDLMGPFFALYRRAIPLAEGRSKIYYGAEGAYFPETMTIFGTYANGDYGWSPKKSPGDISCRYWAKAWNQGPELVSLMLDYWDWTGDQAFLRETLLPTARSVLRYFDTRFKRDSNGHIVLDPTQSIESFWYGVINDMPTAAGLNDITTRLAALPADLVSPDDRAYFARMKAACPAIPTEERTLKGTTTQVPSLAVAEKYSPRRNNVENPELYAVWPFHLYGVGLPHLDLARNAFATRTEYLPVGWGPDGNAAARLGLADEAAAILEKKLSNSHAGYSFPATWGPNFDWLPDQNHAGNLLETTQLMLMQNVGRKILLFPAWPKTWDVQFKLHAPGNTIVEGSFVNGKAGPITVTPADRAADVINCSNLDPAAIERAVETR